MSEELDVLLEQMIDSANDGDRQLFMQLNSQYSALFGKTFDRFLDPLSRIYDLARNTCANAFMNAPVTQKYLITKAKNYVRMSFQFREDFPEGNQQIDQLLEQMISAAESGDKVQFFSLNESQFIPWLENRYPSEDSLFMVHCMVRDSCAGSLAEGVSDPQEKISLAKQNYLKIKHMTS